MTAGEAHAAFLGFPLVDLDRLLGPEARALVLAPHPDDESLGTGGLIALAAAAGRACHVAIVTDGSGSHPGSRAWTPRRLAAARQSEAAEALRRLGQPAAAIDFLGHVDAELPCAGPAFERAVETVVGLARRTGSTVLAATWIADPHGDHVAVATIARAAARRLGARLLSYPVWGWTLAPGTTIRNDGALRGVRLDIAAVLDRKRDAVAAHRTQHGQVVDDDPDGFVLPRVLLDPCDRPFEVFIETSA